MCMTLIKCNHILLLEYKWCESLNWRIYIHYTYKFLEVLSGGYIDVVGTSYSVVLVWI